MHFLLDGRMPKNEAKSIVTLCDFFRSAGRPAGRPRNFFFTEIPDRFAGSAAASRLTNQKNDFFSYSRHSRLHFSGRVLTVHQPAVH